MTHWIIEDQGFSGTWYMCGNCRYRWNDIYWKHSSLGPCPKCGAEIDVDKAVYIEDKPRVSIVSPRLTYGELENKLIQLTGYDLEKLVELFAAGYTLNAPEYKYKSFEELAKEAE